MSNDANRMRKIASNLGEEDRIKQLSSAADVRRDIEETLGYDIVNQETLVKLADNIWQNVPANQRGRFTAEDWQKAIHDRCTNALVRAEQRLEENKIDDKMHVAKVKILRQTFGQQVVRAMQQNNKINGVDMSDGESPTILIADDHPLFREALQRVAVEVFADHVFREVACLDKAMEAALEDDGIELIFLDLNMPGMEGFSGLVSLRNAVPSVPIIVVSATEDGTTVREAITCGASGFMPKSLSKDEMVAAVRSVLDGGVFVPNLAANQSERQVNQADALLAESISQLTHQQRVVLQMLVSGQSNKQIAYELTIVESTVKAHVSAILRKLRVHSRTQAVIKAGKILAYLGQLSERIPA